MFSDMTGDRRQHVPPARVRYRERHPTVTISLPDREANAKLTELSIRSGLSRGHLVKRALGVVEEDVERIEQAVQEGWELGMSDGHHAYSITFPCSGCGQPMEVRAGSAMAKAATDHLVEQGWVHGACYERRFGPPPAS